MSVAKIIEEGFHVTIKCPYCSEESIRTLGEFNDIITVERCDNMACERLFVSFLRIDVNSVTVKIEGEEDGATEY